MRRRKKLGKHFRWCSGRVAPSIRLYSLSVKCFFSFLLRRGLKDLYCPTVAHVLDFRQVPSITLETSFTFMFIFYVLSFVHLFHTARVIAPIGALLHRRDNPVTDGDFELLAMPIKIWSNCNPVILQYSYVAGWFFFSLSHTHTTPASASSVYECLMENKSVLPPSFSALCSVKECSGS